MGTALEYTHFENYMNKVSPYDNIPSPWKDVFFDMGYGIVLALLFVVHIVYFPLS